MSTSPETNEIDSGTASRREIELLIEHYTNNLPGRKPEKQTDAPMTRLNVVLTGSTGSLGSWMFRSLSEDPSIDTIYCLDRSTDAREEH